MTWKATTFGPPVPKSVDLEQGIVTYGDGLRLDLEAVRLFLEQPVGTRMIRPDGTAVEWLGRSGDQLVFRNIVLAAGLAAPKEGVLMSGEDPFF